jgi:broad specificity phosphatase PhoE
MSSQIIHLFRHAEAHQNAQKVSTILDPHLTGKGNKQAARIVDTYKFFNKPTLILSSPSKRCLETIFAAFDPVLNYQAGKTFDRLPRIIALPHLQETSEHPCDTGSPLSAIKAEYENWVEFPDDLFTSEEWYVKRGTAFADDPKLLAKRAEFVRSFILGCPEREIIVISHGDFSNFLVNRWLHGPGCGTRFDGFPDNACGIPFKIVSTEDGTHLEKQIPDWYNSDNSKS